MAKRKNASPKGLQDANGGVGGEGSPAVFRVTKVPTTVIKFRGQMIAMGDADVVRDNGKVIPAATQEQLAWWHAHSEYWARHIERVEAETDNEDGGNTIAEQHSEGQPVTEGEASEGEGV